MAIGTTSKLTPVVLLIIIMPALLFELPFGHEKSYFSPYCTFFASTLEVSISLKSNDYFNGEWNIETKLEPADVLLLLSHCCSVSRKARQQSTVVCLCIFKFHIHAHIL